jgi:PEP-CTERM motif
MKLNMKLSMLAGAVALAIAGQANATTSDLFLTVYDSTAGTMYSRDLGVNMSSFLADISGTTPSTLAAASAGNMSFAADANLTSFLAGVGTSDALVWNVTAANTGSNGFKGESVLVTSTLASAPASQPNGPMTSAVSNQGVFYSAVPTFTNGSTTSTSTLLGNSEVSGGKIAFNTTASLGSGMDMYYVTPSSTSSLAKVAYAVFGGAANADVWTLSSTGNLTAVAAVAAVPEPGEWLLMLSGLGLIGFIATRRKNQGSALNFA